MVKRSVLILICLICLLFGCGQKYVYEDYFGGSYLHCFDGRTASSVILLVLDEEDTAALELPAYRPSADWGANYRSQVFSRESSAYEKLPAAVRERFPGCRYFRLAAYPQAYIEDLYKELDAAWQANKDNADSVWSMVDLLELRSEQNAVWVYLQRVNKENTLRFKADASDSDALFFMQMPVGRDD